MNKEIIIGGSVLLFLVLAFIGNYNIQKMHSGGFYRTSEEIETLGNVVYYEEGLYATVSVRELTREFPTRQHAKALYINGIGQGSTELLPLRTNLLLAHLPVLIKPEIKNAIVIGLGTGMTSGHLSQFTNIKTIEIESKVFEAAPHFELFNLNVLNNPNHELIIDDGRNWLLKNNEKHDVIITAPANIWQSLSTNLFSKEFLEIINSDLSENGLYVQWVPVYSMSPEDFKSFYATFTSVFPNVVAFANIKPTEDTPFKFETTEIILIGSQKEIKLDKENFIKDYNLIPEISRQYLDVIILRSGEDIYNLFMFNNTHLKDYASGSELVTDDNLLLEFSTAKNVLTQNENEVINDIKKFISG